MKNNEFASEKRSIQNSFSVDMNSVIQPPTPWCSTVKWGAHHIFDIKLSNSIVYSCFPLTDYYTNIGNNTSIQGRINDFVTITSNSIIRFDGETRAIKEISKCSYCAGVYVPIHDVIIAVSATTSHFIFIRPEDMKHPIESEFRSMQFPCFHINFLKKSHILITSGNDIRIWNLECVLPSRNIITIKPQISISLRASIDIGFEFNYLNSPCIDYLNELIILPRGSGFFAYNINGQLVKEMTKLPTTSQTLVSFLPNEELEIDQNKSKKMINQKLLKKHDYQQNTFTTSINSKSDTKDEKNDSNHTDNSVLITADSENGVCEWNPNSALKRRHTSGNSNIIAIRLINKCFFLYIDIKNKIYIVDMLSRTPRMFLVATSDEKPLSMIMFRTNSVSSALQFGLILCINTTISIYQIVVPWKLFAPSLIKPSLIKFCPRRNRAARIQVQTSNSDLYLISPKTSQPITSAAPNNPKKVIDTLYDRGLFTNESRDQLIIVVENGEIVCFNTASIPCETITTIDYHAAAIFLAYASKSIFNNNIDDFPENEIINPTNLSEKENDNETNSIPNHNQNNDKELCYCVATQNGEIFLCDYNSFKCKKRYIIQTGIVKTAKYDMIYGTVIMSYLNMLLRFDIQNGVILEKLKQVPSGVVTSLEKGILLIGYENGRITMIKIREKKLEIMKNEGISYHTSAVTGFSFGSNFFLSSSTDQTIKIWSLKGETVGAISLPLPLYGVEIFNGKRDILVGTDKEIMIIEGRSIFMDEFEQRDDVLDNYNEKDDELSNDDISPLQKQEEEKQVFLVSCKAVKEEDENKNKKKEDETKSSNNFAYLNNQNKRNRSINYYNTDQKTDKNNTTQKREIDEQTRRHIIEQMTKISSNSTLSTRIAEREKMLLEQKTKQIEDEYKQEKEQRRLQGILSLEEQELALKKRKEETILKRKREQEERERKEKERKEKEERERRERKEREEREKREKEEQERKEREERERKEREEQERKEREERERLEREEQERLEREEQERLEREEQERLEREEKERLEREEKERFEQEEQERLEREGKERLEKEEKERLEKEEKERLEKEKQNQRFIYPPDDDPPSQTPRMNQIKKQKNKEEKEDEIKEQNKKESSKKKKRSESHKNQSKEKPPQSSQTTSQANVITFPNVLIQENQPQQEQQDKQKADTKNSQNLTTKMVKSSKPKAPKSKEKTKTIQPNQPNKEEEMKKDFDEEDIEDNQKASSFKIELVKWISNDGKVFNQTKKGDWIDEQKRVFQKQPNGSFVTSDSVIWSGPNIQKGRFVTAKGSKNLDSTCQRFLSSNNSKIYTNLGDNKWSDSDGQIYTKGKDDKFYTDNKKNWNGPDGNGFFEKMFRPKEIVGSNGKVYKLNKKGDYVCNEGNVKSKNKDTKNRSFVTEDGVLMKMIDDCTFLGSDGNIYRSDENKKLTSSNGKSYENKLPPPEPEPIPATKSKKVAEPKSEKKELNVADIPNKLVDANSSSVKNLNSKQSKKKTKAKNNIDKDKKGNEKINADESKKNVEEKNENKKEVTNEENKNEKKTNLINENKIKKEENETKNEENQIKKEVKEIENEVKEDETKKEESENKTKKQKENKLKKPNKKVKKSKKKDDEENDESEKEEENKSEKEDDDVEGEKDSNKEEEEDNESEKDSKKDDESEKKEESESEKENENEKEEESENEEQNEDEESKREEESENDKESDETEDIDEYNEDSNDEYDDENEYNEDSKKVKNNNKVKRKENEEEKSKDETKSKSKSKDSNKTKENSKTKNASLSKDNTTTKDTKESNKKKSNTKSKGKEENNENRVSDNEEDDSNKINEKETKTNDNFTDGNAENNNKNVEEEESNDDTLNNENKEINCDTEMNENEFRNATNNKDENENEDTVINDDQREITENSNEDNDAEADKEDLNNKRNNEEEEESKATDENNNYNEENDNYNNNENESDNVPNDDTNENESFENAPNNDTNENQPTNNDNQIEDTFKDNNNEEEERNPNDNDDTNDSSNLNGNQANDVHAEEEAAKNELNPNDDNLNESNLDVFKLGEVYKSHDGDEYEKTDDNTFIDRNGKSFTLNENGDYAAEDGTVMPLSNEELFYAEPNGSLYRPLQTKEDDKNSVKSDTKEPNWIDSEGKIFKPTDEILNKNVQPQKSLPKEDNTSNNQDDNNNNDDDFNDYYYDDEQKPLNKKLVADDGTVWNGPNPETGKFGGKKIKKTPVQWVTNDGVVFIPSNKETAEWTNSENKKYIKENESDSNFVRVDDNKNENETWEGPVTGKGHWVTGKGNVIDSDKGIWVSPDKKVYTAVKTGYVQNDNGRLYKPFITSQGRAIDDGDKDNFLVSDDGKDLLKIGEKEGQFISNSGEIYTSIDNDGKEWIDNYGVIYRPNHDGNYLVSDETKQKWQGPPFFNHQKLIKDQFGGFKHNKIKLKYPSAMTLPKRDVVHTNYEVKIGKPRSSTPLYKVPPLKYPPNMHSKYKPFRFRPKTPPGDNGYFYSKFNTQNDNPRKDRLRILNQHAIPPPNIIVDEREVIRLIESGQKQLIPLLRRIASEHPSKILARNYLKKIDRQISYQSYNNYDDNYDTNSRNDDEITNVSQKYRGKFNIKFDLDLDAVAPTPIGNLINGDNNNIKSPEKPKTKSARSFVHYNNVLNPMNKDQDYLNLYLNRTKRARKKNNDDEDDRYTNIDNSYSSNGFYQSRKREPKSDDRMRPFSVHNAATDIFNENSIIAQQSNKPKLVIPQSARRQKKS